MTPTEVQVHQEFYRGYRISVFGTGIGLELQTLPAEVRFAWRRAALNFL